MPGGTVDLIDGEVRTPVAVPIGLRETFDREDDGTDVVGNLRHILVVLVGVEFLIRSKQVDH